MTALKPCRRAILALLLATPVAAGAAEPSLFGEAPPLRRDGDGFQQRYYVRAVPQARQGLLVSVGLGGGSLYLSNEGPGRVGAADLDFRLGYGISDRLQLFMDFNTDLGSNYNGDSVGSWTWTVRGQTVLVGDRSGNGLNLNLGVGFGGLTYATGYSGRSSGPTGLALAGGLSFDARITPWCSFSPELFYTWHQVPNAPGTADDVSSVYGVRLNLLWYLH